jgi:hypothetical protein
MPEPRSMVSPILILAACAWFLRKRLVPNP